jgi:multiple sugar transport system substrate-binding protein
MEKVIVQSVAGVGPDLFDSYSVFQSSAFIKAGIAWDITDRLREAGIDVANDVWKAMDPYLVHDGRIYGFPRNVAADAVFYNKDLFEQNGIPAPKARLGSDEFLELARKLTVRDSAGRIKHFGFIFGWHNWASLVNQWGGRIYSPDGTRCEIDCPESVAALQYLQDLSWKHNVMPTPQQETAMATSGGWGSGTITWFGGGRAAMASGGRWWLCLLRDKKQYPNLRCGVVEVQFGPVRRYWVYGGGVMINRKSPRREQALDFLKYMDWDPSRSSRRPIFSCMIQLFRRRTPTRSGAMSWRSARPRRHASSSTAPWRTGSLTNSST